MMWRMPQAPVASRRRPKPGAVSRSPLARVTWVGALVASAFALPKVHARSEASAQVHLVEEPKPTEAHSTLTEAMQVELQRSMTQLLLPNRPPAYYGAFWLVDFEQRYVSASLGSVVTSTDETGRRIGVELRVGDHTLDNSNFADINAEPELISGERLRRAALGDDPLVLRRAFWLAADASYRDAIELLDQKKAQRSSEVELDGRPPDFSVQQLRSIQGADVPSLPTTEALRDVVVEASRVFVQFPNVDSSSVGVEGTRVERVLVTSEGVVSREPSRWVEFRIEASAQAADGMQISRQSNVLVREDDSRFGREAVLQEARVIAAQIGEERDAELVEDYLGPVLFEERAAPQIAYEFLAMSLSGTGQGEVGDGIWGRKLGKRVLPDNFTVYDDPTVSSLRGLPLFGYYAMDDEGVASERVSLVEKGRLRNLLTSRTPSRVSKVSNGHGRSGLSGWARGMLGNLIVEATGGRDRRALRQRLLKAVAEEGGEYGIVVQGLQSRGFATGGMAPPSPTRVFKLYPDGREVLVRGATFGEMNLRDLRSIIGNGSALHGYHFRVEWPSGLSSPTSVYCPDLLFEEVELKKPKLSFSRPRVLDRPAR